MLSNSLHELTTMQLDQYSGELEHAIDIHSRWIARINRALLFGEGAHADDLVEHPHLRCAFGNWYHRLDDTPLLDLPEFAAIGAVHGRAHGLARALLLQRQKRGLVSAADYDAWAQSGEDLRRLFQAVRDGIRHNMGLASRLMAKVFENAAEGVVITTPDGTILTVNRAFSEVTGYTAEEAVGRTPHILHSGRQDRDFYANMWRKLLADGDWQGEIWNRRKNGDVYLEWLSIACVRNEHGQTTHYVAIFSDITTEKENAERLYHLAHYDPLTELPNRVLFQDRFKQAIARARRGERRIAVMFLDLDGFKKVNDQFGHSAGDALLAQVAARLAAQLRESDTVARLGGDEFSIILPDMFETDGLIQVATKVIDAIAAPFMLGGQATHITTSIGISIYPKDGLDADNLLQRADLAMYEAKRRGKNQFCFFEPGMG
jgi:diguanylate cyclase (GGDEF)-like protein/PAS domain S-box-containing protein